MNIYIYLQQTIVQLYIGSHILNLTQQAVAMGVEQSGQVYKYQLSVPENCKLYSVLPINSPAEQQQMEEILQRRKKMAECPYICAVRDHDFLNEELTRFTCSHEKKLVVYYDAFDYRLADVGVKNYPREFGERQICNLIRCVVEALCYLRGAKASHGDVSLENIVRRGGYWKLVDKAFIKNGINNYEKVLEGESGFISPKQMMRIRFGFVKQSPDLVEADDIFSLGMVILQLASEVPSTLCYKEMNIRFNEAVLNQNISACSQRYSPEFNAILKGMLELQEEDRITLNQLKQRPLIKSTNLFNVAQAKNAEVGLQSRSRVGANGRQTLSSNPGMRSNTVVNRTFADQARKPLTPTTPTHVGSESAYLPTPRVNMQALDSYYPSPNYTPSKGNPSSHVPGHHTPPPKLTPGEGLQSNYYQVQPARNNVNFGSFRTRTAH